MLPVWVNVVLKMVKILILLMCIAALSKNGYGFDIFGNLTKFTKVLKEITSKSKNENLKITYECIKQLGLYKKDLVGLHDGFWALKMIDATAKIPSGVLTFNVAWLGNYDECLAIESNKKDVKGKYCLAGITAISPITNQLNYLKVIAEEYIKLINTNRSVGAQLAFLPSIGLCIPHKCNAADVKSILHTLISTVSFSVTCQTKEDLNKPLDSGAIFTICYFGVFVLFMTFSTIYDIYRDHKIKPHPLLIAFSTYTNGKKLFKSNTGCGELSCLNGIRFISMLWVIVGHEFISLLMGPLVNFLEMIKYFTTTRSLFFANGVYSVDTFFVVGGFLVVYNFMKTHSHGRKFNIVKFYLHRYLRFTHALVPVLLSTLFLMQYLGSGPFYPQTEQLSKPCRKYWWSTLLYIENYVNIESRCLGHTWYLNVDWQLYLLAPLYLVFLPKRPIIGLSLMLCATIGTMVSSYTITWNNQLESLETNIHGNLLDFMNKFYMKTHTRAAPWLIGAILGYILGKIKFQDNLTTVQLPKWMVGLGWIIVLTAIPTCIFAGVDTLNSEEYHPYSNAFYNTFARPAWGVCIAWIIFACSLGYGGFINSILSLPMFQILNRFTYSMYLLHHTILYMIVLAQKQPGYFSLFSVTYSFWGIFALTFGLSIFWVLAFESPIPMIEKFVSGSIERRFKRKQQIGENSIGYASTECLLSSKSNDTDNVLP